MKKQTIALFSAVLLIAGSLAGCGGTSTSSSPSEGQGAADSTASVESVNAPEEKSKYYFKDGVLQAEDIKIEITDHKIIQSGEEGNKYGDKPVIAFWYNTTNITGKDIAPSTAWIIMFEAVQDNNPNAINKLKMAALPDSKFLDTQIETIKKDGTVENAVAYKLDDLQTPVTLYANRGLAGEKLGSQTFEIK
ncbi:DUF5067 domain-containing protein [Clostridium minihomine]|uniref:DUF5067 domain-containing protein n=1 Tax=Clostridium minihomine TaxID=2045012 RepID=UPI000C75992A|nr:DUF5067 domain-containing protein [Clostridium minihomine]